MQLARGSTSIGGAAARVCALMYKYWHGSASEMEIDVLAPRILYNNDPVLERGLTPGGEI